MDYEYDAALVQDGMNAQHIRCPFCDCKVLKPRTGALVERPAGIYMHADVRKQKEAAAAAADASAEPDDKPEGMPGTIVGAEERWFWLVKDMFDFENIGFSRDVEGRFKYLTCAECEIPILGIQPDISKADELLVSVMRPKYVADE